MPRTTPRRGGDDGSSTIIVPGGYYGGYYPWGGYGFGGYYGGYYDPYDPWYGAYPAYYPSSYGYVDEGSVRLKVKPRSATVYVDGYYVGVVDDYDGIFQRLHVEAGPHRLEIRAPGYETLSFDVRVELNHTTTYRGEMQKQ